MEYRSDWNLLPRDVTELGTVSCLHANISRCQTTEVVAKCNVQRPFC